MTEPDATQHDLRLDVPDELAAAGLDDIEEIGRGGFGVVYRAAQKALDRTVAVKVLSADLDDENRERFLREEHAMGRLSGHPNIVDVLQVDVTVTGRPFIVMPYHARGSLEDLIRDDGPLGWAQAVRVAIKLCGAVESAHRVGILHRDVKPANVLLTAYGEPQLTDFGIARLPGGFHTSGGMITGSPAFTAPEVLGGKEPTAVSDVYGLGATLFALMTGHAAFERQSGEKVVAQFVRITSQPIPDLREQDIPADLAAAVEAAMATDPGGRPAGAAAFGELLQQVQRAHGFVPDEMALLDGSEKATQRAKVAAPRPTTAAPADTDSRTSTLQPTPATKFRPPTTHREPVRRARLLDVLRAGQARRLAVIHAPAGFGKSTLAAQWRSALLDQDVDVAWLSVDRDDNNAVWFIAHLIEAIRRVRPDIGVDLEAALEERADDAAQYVLGALVDELHTSGEPVVVVIDDWHRINDDAARRALTTLLDAGCHHLRLVVTSREQSGLGMSRMRVRDELVEVDASALRMTAAETREFLLERNGFEMTDAQLDRLYEETEGWPAAVQLVALSLRGGAEPARLVDELSGEHHAIAEYLAENVLNTLDPRMAEFLMAISVTERVTADLADALSGGSDGELMLEEAQRRDLFLHRIAEEPQWFRLQLLFAEFLRARLEREHPGRIRSLNMKASRWYAEHQMLRESVDHAIAAADLKAALDLIESGGLDLIEGSRMATLLGMVSKLPMQQVATRSKLLMTVARANVALQQSGPAKSALGRLTGALARSLPGDADAAAQKLEVAVLEAADRVSADRVDGITEMVAECLTKPDTVPVWAVSLAANVTSFARICDNDFRGARKLQRWARRFHEASDDPMGIVYGRCYAGIAARENLDIAAATESFRGALEIARTRSGKRSHAARLAGSLLGDLHYRKGAVAEAAELLDDSHRLESEVGPVDFMIATFVVGARVLRAGGETAAADARLDEAAELARTRDLPRLAAHVTAERARIDPDSISDVEQNVLDGNGTQALTAAVQEIAAIRALVASDRAAHREEAPRRARELLRRMRSHRRPRAALEVQILLAGAQAGAGWHEEARQTLTDAVVRCAEVGWIRPLRDEPSVADTLAELAIELRAGRGGPAFADVPRNFLDHGFAEPK